MTISRITWLTLFQTQNGGEDHTCDTLQKLVLSKLMKISNQLQLLVTSLKSHSKEINYNSLINAYIYFYYFSVAVVMQCQTTQLSITV